jgi:hypothetical protein
MICVDNKTRELVIELHEACKSGVSIQTASLSSLITKAVMDLGVDTKSTSWETYMFKPLCQGQFLDGDDFEMALNDFIRFEGTTV